MILVDVYFCFIIWSDNFQDNNIFKRKNILNELILICQFYNFLKEIKYKVFVNTFELYLLYNLIEIISENLYSKIY